MGEVTVFVGGRGYQIVCEDGQEDRLRGLADRLDSQAREISSGGVGAVGEARMVVMAALMLADRLEETEAALKNREAVVAAAAAQEAQAPNISRDDQLALFGAAPVEAAIEVIDTAAERLESLVAAEPEGTDPPDKRSADEPASGPEERVRRAPPADEP